jgi:cytochrome c oxidase cbb3-type subunit I/II
VADRHRHRRGLGVFGLNVFGTIAKRASGTCTSRSGSTSPASSPSPLLHIFNNLVIPSGILKSYSIYAGVQDAFMQWWYGHNAVAFVLTTPFLGLMYYFLPKAAERPVFSYRLSILHFWALIFIYIWAGPHHLHYTALPDWARPWAWSSA